MFKQLQVSRWQRRHHHKESCDVSYRKLHACRTWKQTIWNSCFFLKTNKTVKKWLSITAFLGLLTLLFNRYGCSSFFFIAHFSVTRRIIRYLSDRKVLCGHARLSLFTSTDCFFNFSKIFRKIILLQIYPCLWLKNSTAYVLMINNWTSQ